ncbi:hypothetical protein L2E82_44630 [Cichorium intybus]|uniref:Uncharacterized protein n=1 Tax=Cichorium intybus TaxID=13427 RepID=A0ACB8ZR32_CICIN|nr:hypothetical protein L2E82_44630 [Cichorium intybus]
MVVHLSGVFFSKPSISSPVFQHQRRPPLTVLAAASAVPPPSSPPTIHATHLFASRQFLIIVGGKSASWYGNGDMNSSNSMVSFEDEYDWTDLETDLYHRTKTLRPIQMDWWLGNRKRILVLKREDIISAADRNAWADYYGRQGIKVVFSNGQLGMGTMKLGRLAKSVAAGVNMKRRARGLLPRAVRGGIIGYPNVGKSPLINRLLKRRMCPAAPTPGVRRSLKLIRFGSDLELLNSPE